MVIGLGKRRDPPSLTAVLVVLREAAGRALTAVQVADRCEYSPHSVRTRLTDAAHAGLATYTVDGMGGLRHWTITRKGEDRVRGVA